MLRGSRPLLLLVVASLSLPVCFAQSSQQPLPTPPVRDPQAVAILTQCLNAGGSAQTLVNLKDYTGKGNITYFWVGLEVNGTVTVQSARNDQFRLDAQLAQGTRSWVVNGGLGETREADGKQTPIPLHNSLALGSLTFPYSSLLQALNDSTVAVTILPVETVAGNQANHIRIQQTYPSELDPNGDWARWSGREFLIDAATFRILATREILRSNESSAREFVQEIDFSDYRQVNGVSVPFSIVERIGGQETWAIQLDSVSFNTNLSNTIFHF